MSRAELLKSIDGWVMEMRAVERKHLARIADLERRVMELEARTKPRVGARSPYNLSSAPPARFTR